MTRRRTQIEYGDFQTPQGLADMVCRRLHDSLSEPAAIVEPTCGRGSLLIAALKQFPKCRTGYGADINAEHLGALRRELAASSIDATVASEIRDFFQTDWNRKLCEFADPLLIVGNPPWVTNAALGSLGSANLPLKSNIHALKGMDALTGKSNFDISEWMLIRLLEALEGRRATIAMLCKTSVARKVLQHAWRQGTPVSSRLFKIDALKWFGAAVDACLLVCECGQGRATECAVFENLTDGSPSHSIGLRDRQLVADVAAYDETSDWLSDGSQKWRWRSGVKHDCSRVMELVEHGGTFLNGLGETVRLESTFLFPMRKSSEIANGGGASKRWMIVPQQRVGDDTSLLREEAPETWGYLQRHADLLANRSSSIYRNRPPFSVFGVGSYSFAPWKIAISGFYKRLAFAKIGPQGGKPVMLDDTAYFLPCPSEREANRVAALLNSDVARRFLSAFIFWDSKRPITVDVLRRLDIDRLAEALSTTSAGRGRRLFS